MTPENKFESYMKTRDARISICNHLLWTFGDLVDPNDTPGKVGKKWLEAPNKYLKGRRPVDIIRGGNSLEIGSIHRALTAIDTSAFA